MPDHDGPEPRDPRIPGELFRSTAPPASVDLAAALGGLDRATRDFTRRLGESNFPTEVLEERIAAATASQSQPPPEPPAAPVPSATFEISMQDAEREAREYLESAKRRADSIVNTMVGAVEQEAAEIRRGAEEGIRARWQRVEVDATRHVENARRVAEQMVAERQERISRLSDGISGRATALTAGMDDADRVRAQFDAFVRALAVTADQIAKAPAPGGSRGSLHQLRERPRPSAIAA